MSSATAGTPETLPDGTLGAWLEWKRPEAAAPESVVLDAFRETLSRVPGPVTVVTTLAGGRPHGTTVSAFCSL